MRLTVSEPVKTDPEPIGRELPFVYWETRPSDEPHNSLSRVHKRAGDDTRCASYHERKPDECEDRRAKRKRGLNE
jgi:hypothetical protein